MLRDLAHPNACLAVQTLRHCHAQHVRVCILYIPVARSRRGLLVEKCQRQHIRHLFYVLLCDATLPVYEYYVYVRCRLIENAVRVNGKMINCVFMLYEDTLEVNFIYRASDGP